MSVGGSGTGKGRVRKVEDANEVPKRNSRLMDKVGEEKRHNVKKVYIYTDSPYCPISKCRQQ
jgi:hypothetical protein